MPCIIDLKGQGHNQIQSGFSVDLLLLHTWMLVCVSEFADTCGRECRGGVNAAALWGDAAAGRLHLLWHEAWHWEVGWRQLVGIHIAHVIVSCTFNSLYASNFFSFHAPEAFALEAYYN